MFKPCQTPFLGTPLSSLQMLCCRGGARSIWQLYVKPANWHACYVSVVLLVLLCSLLFVIHMLCLLCY